MLGHREAVQHDGDAAGVLAERRDRRLGGVARVDDQRLAGLAREADLRLEGALLVGRGRALAVEVQAGLADRRAARMGGQRAQVGEVGVVEAGGVVGVAADRRADLREGLGGGQRGAVGRRRPSRR